MDYDIVDKYNRIIGIVKERSADEALAHAHYCGYIYGVKAIPRIKLRTMDEDQLYNLTNEELEELIEKERSL